MALSESFVASVRCLERKYRERIIQEQSAFSSNMSAINAVMNAQFPQGMADIARRAALGFVRDAAAECEALQDLAQAEDFDAALKTILDAAVGLLASGSQNMLGPQVNRPADVARGFAASELTGEVRDRLLVAQDKRRARRKDSMLSWKLLFLQSNPRDADSIDTNREHREVRQALREADYRDQVDLVPEPAARIRDVFRAINEHRPRVIHFSGHGHDSRLALLDDRDEARPFDGQDLADFIAANDDQVQLVVLNSCGSLPQALKVLQAVPHVIGTSDSLGDEAAVVFSRAFYSAVAHGRAISSAFRQATVAVRAEISPAAASVYELKSRSDSDASVASLVVPTLAEQKSGQEPLSQEEQDLLKAVPRTGDVHVLKTDQKGKWVRAGAAEFFNHDDPSESARYIEALDSLVSRQLVRHEGGAHFALTGTGWELKRALE